MQTSTVVVLLLCCVIAAQALPLEKLFKNKAIVSGKQARSIIVPPAQYYEASTCFAGFQCLAVGAQCGVDSYNVSDPCNICQTNYTTCLFNAETDAESCACITAGQACVANLGPYCKNYAELIAYSDCQTYSCGSCVNPQVALPICGLNAVCDEFSYRCQLITTNGSCTADDECGNPAVTYDNSYYYCSGDTCVSYSYVGGPCKTDFDCEYGTCTSGVCVGASVGQECVSTLECAPGLFCAYDSDTCNVTVTLGGSCNTTNYYDQLSMCSPPGICGGANWVCVKPYETTVGGSCQSTAECVPGLVCNASNVCGYPIATVSCASDFDCDNDGLTFCYCNPLNGTGVCGRDYEPDNEFGCTSSLQSYIDCYAQNPTNLANCFTQTVCYAACVSNAYYGTACTSAAGLTCNGSTGNTGSSTAGNTGSSTAGNTGSTAGTTGSGAASIVASVVLTASLTAVALF